MRKSDVATMLRTDQALAELERVQKGLSAVQRASFERR
jgi:hypothetical protein